MKVFIDRLGKVWWRDCYEIPTDENGNLNEEILQDAIDDQIKSEWSEPLFGTWEPNDNYEVYNEDWDLIKEYPND